MTVATVVIDHASQATLYLADQHLLIHVKFISDNFNIPSL